MRVTSTETNVEYNVTSVKMNNLARQTNELLKKDSLRGTACFVCPS